jgi:hypothetical protein
LPTAEIPAREQFVRRAAGLSPVLRRNGVTVGDPVCGDGEIWIGGGTVTCVTGVAEL